MDYHYAFKNYYQFLERVLAAMADEKAAARFYEIMMGQAPGQWEREQIKHARDDEVKHYHMLHHLYMHLTGKEPVVREKEIKVKSYRENLKEAYTRELEAVEYYREMMLSTYILHIRDMLLEIMIDEMEHATRFTFLYGETRSEA